VIEAAVAIPFEQLLAGDVSRLSTLKQDVVSAGVKATLRIDMPVNEKRRFQDGATATPRARVSKAWCRRTFNALWQDRQKEADTLDRRSANEVVPAGGRR
jgi:asparagine synthase (glutamine-hydrolysing)